MFEGDSRLKTANRTYENAYAKCNQIWLGCHRPKASEAIGEILGHQLPYPVQTRWATHYRCISALLEEEKNQPGCLKKLFEASKTDKKDVSDLGEHEILVLQEYIQLTAPITNGIDKLQGEKNTFYGDLLPTLFSIKTKLEKLTSLPKLGHLARGLVGELVNHRFKKEFELKEDAKMAICAAFSHPSYKGQWGTEAESEKALLIFKKEYDEVSQQLEFQQNDNSMEIESEDFIQLRAAPLPSVQTELSRFLVDQRKELTMLNEYPVIREIFMKHNTQLPTSAIVERMFNFAGLLNHPNRGRILPTNFEDNVLLKANSVFRRQK